MILRSLPLIILTTGLCHASLIPAAIRQRAEPIQISSTSIPLITSTSSSVPEYFTPSPSIDPRALLPECVGILLDATSSAAAKIASSVAANVSSQIASISTAAAGSISAAALSASSAVASASADVASIQASAAAALDAASSSLAFVSSSASLELASASGQLSSASVQLSSAGVQLSSATAEISSVSASLISAASIETYSAHAAAMAVGTDASQSASQVADTRKAVNTTKNIMLPLTVAVILIIGVSLASSLLSVLVYRFVSKRRRAGKLGPKATGESVEQRHSGGADTIATSSSTSTSSSLYDVGERQSQGADVSISSYYEGAGMKMGTEKGAAQIVAKDLPSPEDNDSRYSMDIEKEIAAIYQSSWGQSELEREKDKRRVSDLSRSSKSISALFAPRGVPIKLPEGTDSKTKEMSERAIEEKDDKDGVEVMLGIDTGYFSSQARTGDTKQKGGEEENQMLQFTLSPSVYSRPENGSSSSSSSTSGQQAVKAKEKGKGKGKGVGVGKFRFSIGKAV